MLVGGATPWWVGTATWKEASDAVMDSVFGLVGAAVETLELNRLHLPAALQGEDLKVSRREGNDLWGAVHGVGDLHQAWDTHKHLILHQYISFH